MFQLCFKSSLRILENGIAEYLGTLLNLRYIKTVYFELVSMFILEI